MFYSWDGNLSIGSTFVVGQSTKRVDGGKIGGPAEISGCVQIRFIFQMANQKHATWSLYGQNSGSFVPSVAVANSLFTSFTSSFTNHFGTLWNISFQFLQLGVRDMTNKLNPEFLSSAAAVQIGSGSTAMPQDVALVLTANCSERGRGAKGRVYIVGWSTVADSGNGQASGAAVTAMNALNADIFSFLQAASLTPCVAKPARQEYLGITGTHHDARNAHVALVSSYRCQDNEFDTQRRRGL
jgi:hypothetical protein